MSSIYQESFTQDITYFKSYLLILFDDVPTT